MEATEQARAWHAEMETKKKATGGESSNSRYYPEESERNMRIPDATVSHSKYGKVSLSSSLAETAGGFGRKASLRRRMPNSESVERMLHENRALKNEILDSIEDLHIRLDKHVERRKAALKERRELFELAQRRREAR